MAIDKMVGSWMLRDPAADDTVAPTLDLDTSRDLLRQQVSSMAKEGYTLQQAVDIINLGPIVQIPDIVPTIRNLSEGTIIPRFDANIAVASMAGVVLGSLPTSVFSPSPTSILGLGNLMGAIVIMLGKAVVVEIAADVSMDTMRRIGQRVSAGYRIRGRTGQVVKGNLQQTTTQVKPVLGRSGFLPNRQHYDGPCDWWEFWCWIV